MKNECCSSSCLDHRFIKGNKLLDGMISKPIDQAGLSVEELSEFIEMCWVHDYGATPRMRFSPGFLEWNMGKDLSGMAVLGSTRELLGVYLFFERYYWKDGKARPYVFETCLSVHPAHRGKGIAQWLGIGLRRMVSDKDVDFYLTWRDTRQIFPGSSFRICTANTSDVNTSEHVNILLRILDFNKALEYLATNAFDVLSLKLKTRFYSAPKENCLPNGYTLESFREEMIPACHDFLVRYQASSGAFLIPAVEEFMRWQPGRYDAARFYALREQGRGRIRGLYFGHKVPLDGEWFYFQADGILIDPDLHGTVTRAFFEDVESRLLKEGPCMGCIVVETGCEESLWKYGYLPEISHLLILSPCRVEEIETIDLKRGLIDLR